MRMDGIYLGLFQSQRKLPGRRARSSTCAQRQRPGTHRFVASRKPAVDGFRRGPRKEISRTTVEIYEFGGDAPQFSSPRTTHDKWIRRIRLHQVQRCEADETDLPGPPRTSRPISTVTGYSNASGIYDAWICPMGTRTIQPNFDVDVRMLLSVCMASDWFTSNQRRHFKQAASEEGWF